MPEQRRLDDNLEAIFDPTTPSAQTDVVELNTRRAERQVHGLAEDVLVDDERHTDGVIGGRSEAIGVGEISKAVEQRIDAHHAG